MFNISDNKMIGIGLTLLGIFMTFLGVMLFFDRFLLICGDVCFILGMFILVGVDKTGRFFLRGEKAVGSIFYFGGIALILYGFTLIGCFAQMYGVWRLFSGFLPNILQAVRMSPVGWIFSLPGLSKLSEWIKGSQRLPL
eukprot:GHVR01004603.1.p1 GENE.GHVR01004603.1~~GHVR01004603.1.p1  ORF type:complete len:139 (+),score=21.65 GHVR01004603.1:130-546(+)